MAEVEVKRDKRVTVSLTGDAYENIKEIARRSGITPAAWMALVVTQQSMSVLETQQALLDAAREQVRSVFGKQEVIDLLTEAKKELDGEDAT